MIYNYIVCLKNANGMFENYTVGVPTQDMTGWNKAIEEARAKLGSTPTEAPQSVLFAGIQHSVVK